MTMCTTTLRIALTVAIVIQGTVFSRADDAQRPADEVGPRYDLYHERVNEDFPPAMHMPNPSAIAQNTQIRENPKSGQFCYQARYQLARQPWSAVAFNLDGVPLPERQFNMFEKLEAKQGDRIVVRFYARSPDKARAQFKVGGGDGDSLA